VTDPPVELLYRRLDEDWTSWSWARCSSPPQLDDLGLRIVELRTRILAKLDERPMNVGCHRALIWALYRGFP
jgi:hypothetical protein